MTLTLKYSNKLNLFAAFFAVSILLLSSAFAQETEETEYTDVDLGVRQQGESYTLSLGAENINCEQLLDFRFSSKTPWIKLPEDSVVRQVPAGETRFIRATLDLSNVPPGNHQGYVDVNCENCGFFIFKNCQISKQELRLNMQVNAAPPPPPPPPAAQNQEGAQGPAGQQGQEGPQGPEGQQGQQGPAGAPPAIVLSPLHPPKVDYKDKRIPWRLRDKARRDYDAWVKALKKKNDCDKELAELQAAYDAAKAKADQAARIADTAEQDARNAKAQIAAAQDRLLAANIAANKARDDIKKAKEDLAQAQRNGTAAEREAAKKAITAAETALADALKDIDEAGKDKRLHSPKQIKAMEKNAKVKRGEAKAAAKAAEKAKKALTKKQKECLKLTNAAAAAEAAKTASEDAAKPPPPPAPKKPTQKDIDDQKKAVQKCVDELGQLLEAQRRALEALAKYGGLTDNPESDLKLWAGAVDDANDIFAFVPPGIPIVSEMVGTVQNALTAVRGVMGIAIGVTGLGNTVHVPKHGNDTVSPEDTQKKLQSDGFADSPAEAKRVYEQMKNYSKTSPPSTEKMQEELEAKKKECEAKHKRLDDLKKAFSK